MGRDLLRKGLSWTVGNGESILVWQDPWLSCETPSTPIGPPSLINVNMRVCDLLCPLTNDWDRGKIREALPHYEDHILRFITSFAPPQDCLAWLFDKSGSYSVRSGYNVGLLNSRSHPLLHILLTG